MVVSGLYKCIYSVKIKSDWKRGFGRDYSLYIGGRKRNFKLVLADFGFVQFSYFHKMSYFYQNF